MTPAAALAPVAMGRGSAVGSAVVVGSDKPAGLAFWSVVIAAVAGLELLARRHPERLPSAGSLVGHYLGHPALRAVAVAVWLYAGWHLFSH